MWGDVTVTTFVGGLKLRFQNATSLGDAVLADGPVLTGEPGLLGLFEDFGEIVGEAEAGVAAGGGFTEKARVLCAEVNTGSGVLRRVKHHVCIGGIERRLEKSAVDGFKKDGGRDPLRLGEDEGLAE